MHGCGLLMQAAVDRAGLSRLIALAARVLVPRRLRASLVAALAADHERAFPPLDLAAFSLLVLANNAISRTASHAWHGQKGNSESGVVAHASGAAGCAGAGAAGRPPALLAALVTWAVAYRSDGPISSISNSMLVRFSPSFVS